MIVPKNGVFGGEKFQVGGIGCNLMVFLAYSNSDDINLPITSRRVDRKIKFSKAMLDTLKILFRF